MDAGKAIKLVEVTPEGEFKLSDEAINALSEMGDRKVAPVVIGGPWRSGKSFLANRLIGETKGFAVGNTAKACTKGIWMWSQPITSKIEDASIIVMDAEGLNSSERVSDTDVKIFALSLLISSLFIYNQRGQISESSLDDLSAIIKLTEYINVKKYEMPEKETGVEFHKYFPIFYYVLRDFSLDPLKKTPREYLEDNIKPHASEEKNAIKQAVAAFFPDRDCFALARPISEESKTVRIEDLKYDQLRPEFTKACDMLVDSILTKAAVKKINGVPLTASMLIGLLLEYIQSLNDNEVPTILSTVERVLQDEARRHTEKLLEDYMINISQRLPESSFPIDSEELSAIVSQANGEVLGELVRELHEFCTPTELHDSYNEFDERLKIEADRLTKSNMEYSVEACDGLLLKLTENMALPKIQSSSDVKPTIMIDFINEWTRVADEYKKAAKGPAKEKALFEFVKAKIFASMGETLKDLVEVFTDSENKLKLYLTELQASEKKWKTLVENNEKILVERSQEKDELVAQNSELDMKQDQLQRELKNKENEIKSVKNLQVIELANLKQISETALKEKMLIIDDLNKKVDSITARLEELEAENQNLQNENIRNLAKLKNPIPADPSPEEAKKKPKVTGQQSLVSSLYKNIKSSFDEFKTMLGDLNEACRLKKQISDLQRELNDREFTANKKMLEIRKEMGSQITDVKLKHENEMRTFTGDLEGLKQSNLNLREKLNQSENKFKMLNAKLINLQEEKALMEENLKIKEELVQQFKASAEQESEKGKMELKSRQEVEMELSRTKVDLAFVQEDIEALFDCIVFLADNYHKKKFSIKEYYEKIRSEKMKKDFIERLEQAEIKYDLKT